MLDKLSIFKQPACGHPHCDICVPGREWYVLSVPAGMIVAKLPTWTAALDYASDFLRAALTPEVCS